MPQEDIAEAVNVDRTVVSDMMKGFVEIGNLAENHKSLGQPISRRCCVSQPFVSKLKASLITVISEPSEKMAVELGVAAAAVPRLFVK